MLKEKITKYLTKAMLTFVVYTVLYHKRQQYQAGMLDLLQLSQQTLPLKSHWLEAKTVGQLVGLWSELLHIEQTVVKILKANNTEVKTHHQMPDP